jgi:solute carrier family 36 (proton-coupled amino acid transporter)
VYATFLVLALTPIAWVRKIKKFSFTFLVGIIMMLIALLVTSIFVSSHVKKEGFGEGNLKFNNVGFSAMIGYSIYSFEGIGIVMPVMQSTSVPEKFEKILIAAMSTIAFCLIIFSLFCSLAYGEN